MENTQEILNMAGLSYVYTHFDVLINLAVSIILGLYISFIYKTTHKGVSYSQSFILTIVFITIIVSMVMMVIGNNIARAFALVGALSIIRFRTVVKDTKDTAYIFLALASGMAAGTSSYFLAVSGSLVTSLVAYILFITNYGSIYSSEFILRFRSMVKKSGDAPEYSKILSNFSTRANMLHVEPSGDSLTTKLTFDIILKKDKTPMDLSIELSKLDGISEIVVVASEHDIDY